jgi:hypothetical protein
MKKEIMMAGLGWISAGVICLEVWLVERSYENAAGLFFTGLVVIIVGAWLLLLNKKLEKTMARFEAEAAKRKLARN